MFGNDHAQFACFKVICRESVHIEISLEDVRSVAYYLVDIFMSDSLPQLIVLNFLYYTGVYFHFYRTHRDMTSYLRSDQKKQSHLRSKRDRPLLVSCKYDFRKKETALYCISVSVHKHILILYIIIDRILHGKEM